MTIPTPDRRRYPAFTIGDRLRKARTLLGSDMDVAAFAELIGVSRNTVTNYELERTTPDRMKPVVLSAWALATGVDVGWLRTGGSPNEEGPHPDLRDEGHGRPEHDSNVQPTGLLTGNRTFPMTVPRRASPIAA